MITDKLIYLSVLLVPTHAQLLPPFDIPAHAQFETSSTTSFGWVLKRHVFKTVSNLLGVGQCFMQCSFTDYCYSLNFYPHVGVCELNTATNTSHPGDFVASGNGSYMLYILRPITICDDSFCAGDQTCHFGEDGVSRQCKACSEALGMEDRSIPDSAIVSSSTYGKGASPSGGKFARLHNVKSVYGPCCWAPAYNTSGQYLQVDLGQVKLVKKIATQGRVGNQVKYVTKYIVRRSMDGQTWGDYEEKGVVKVFDGNFDRMTVVTNSFQDKIPTRYIRVVVQSWVLYIELRMELYGCAL